MSANTQSALSLEVLFRFYVVLAASWCSGATVGEGADPSGKSGVC